MADYDWLDEPLDPYEEGREVDFSRVGGGKAFIPRGALTSRGRAYSWYQQNVVGGDKSKPLGTVNPFDQEREVTKVFRAPFAQKAQEEVAPRERTVFQEEAAQRARSLASGEGPGGDAWMARSRNETITPEDAPVPAMAKVFNRDIGGTLDSLEPTPDDSQDLSTKVVKKLAGVVARTNPFASLGTSAASAFLNYAPATAKAILPEEAQKAIGGVPEWDIKAPMDPGELAEQAMPNPLSERGRQEIGTVLGVGRQLGTAKTYELPKWRYVRDELSGEQKQADLAWEQARLVDEQAKAKKSGIEEAGLEDLRSQQADVARQRTTEELQQKAFSTADVAFGTAGKVGEFLGDPLNLGFSKLGPTLKFGMEQSGALGALGRFSAKSAPAIEAAQKGGGIAGIFKNPGKLAQAGNVARGLAGEAAEDIVQHPEVLAHGTTGGYFGAEMAKSLGPAWEEMDVAHHEAQKTGDWTRFTETANEALGAGIGLGMLAVGSASGLTDSGKGKYNKPVDFTTPRQQRLSLERIFRVKFDQPVGPDGQSIPDQWVQKDGGSNPLRVSLREGPLSSSVDVARGTTGERYFEYNKDTNTISLQKESRGKDGTLQRNTTAATPLHEMGHWLSETGRLKDVVGSIEDGLKIERGTLGDFDRMAQMNVELQKRLELESDPATRAEIERMQVKLADALNAHEKLSEKLESLAGPEMYYQEASAVANHPVVKKIFDDVDAGGQDGLSARQELELPVAKLIPDAPSSIRGRTLNDVYIATRVMGSPEQYNQGRRKQGKAILQRILTGKEDMDTILRDVEAGRFSNRTEADVAKLKEQRPTETAEGIALGPAIRDVSDTAKSYAAKRRIYEETAPDAPERVGVAQEADRWQRENVAARDRADKAIKAAEKVLEERRQIVDKQIRAMEKDGSIGELEKKARIDKLNTELLQSEARVKQAKAALDKFASEVGGRISNEPPPFPGKLAKPGTVIPPKEAQLPQGDESLPEVEVVSVPFRTTPVEPEGLPAVPEPRALGPAAEPGERPQAAAPQPPAPAPPVIPPVAPPASTAPKQPKPKSTPKTEVPKAEISKPAEPRPVAEPVPTQPPPPKQTFNRVTEEENLVRDTIRDVGADPAKVMKNLAGSGLSRRRVIEIMDKLQDEARRVAVAEKKAARIAAEEAKVRERQEMRAAAKAEKEAKTAEKKAVKKSAVESEIERLRRENEELKKATTEERSDATEEVDPTEPEPQEAAAAEPAPAPAEAPPAPVKPERRRRYDAKKISEEISKGGEFSARSVPDGANEKDAETFRKFYSRRTLQKPLSEEEELKLGRLLASTDATQEQRDDALLRLMSGVEKLFYRLAGKYAKQYNWLGNISDDLESAAVIRVIEKAKEFNPQPKQKGDPEPRFSSYAGGVAEKAILTTVHQMERTAKRERALTDAEPGEGMDAEAALERAASENEWTPGRTQAKDQGQTDTRSPEDLAISSENQVMEKRREAYLSSVSKELTKREQEALAMRGAGSSLRAIGRRLGVMEKEAARIVKDARAKAKAITDRVEAGYTFGDAGEPTETTKTLAEMLEAKNLRRGSIRLATLEKEYRDSLSQEKRKSAPPSQFVTSLKSESAAGRLQKLGWEVGEGAAKGDLVVRPIEKKVGEYQDLEDMAAENVAVSIVDTLKTTLGANDDVEFGERMGMLQKIREAAEENPAGPYANPAQFGMTKELKKRPADDVEKLTAEREEKMLVDLEKSGLIERSDEAIWPRGSGETPATELQMKLIDKIEEAVEARIDEDPNWIPPTEEQVRDIVTAALTRARKAGVVTFPEGNVALGEEGSRIALGGMTFAEAEAEAAKPEWQRKAGSQIGDPDSTEWQEAQPWNKSQPKWLVGLNSKLREMSDDARLAVRAINRAYRLHGVVRTGHVTNPGDATRRRVKLTEGGNADLETIANAILFQGTDRKNFPVKDLLKNVRTDPAVSMNRLRGEQAAAAQRLIGAGQLEVDQRTGLATLTREGMDALPEQFKAALRGENGPPNERTIKGLKELEDAGLVSSKGGAVGPYLGKPAEYSEVRGRHGIMSDETKDLNMRSRAELGMWAKREPKPWTQTELPLTLSPEGREEIRSLARAVNAAGKDADVKTWRNWSEDNRGKFLKPREVRVDKDTLLEYIDEPTIGKLVEEGALEVKPGGYTIGIKGAKDPLGEATDVIGSDKIYELQRNRIINEKGFIAVDKVDDFVETVGPDLVEALENAVTKKGKMDLIQKTPDYYVVTKKGLDEMRKERRLKRYGQSQYSPRSLAGMSELADRPGERNEHGFLVPYIRDAMLEGDLTSDVMHAGVVKTLSKAMEEHGYKSYEDIAKAAGKRRVAFLEYGDQSKGRSGALTVFNGDGSLARVYELKGSEVTGLTGFPNRNIRRTGSWVERIIEKSAPGSPVRIAYAALAELGVKYDLANDAFSKAGRADVEMVTPDKEDLEFISDWMRTGKKFEYQPGDSRAGQTLTRQELSRGFEDLRDGRYATPEAYAVSSVAVDLSRERLLAEYKSGKLEGKSRPKQPEVPFSKAFRSARSVPKYEPPADLKDTHERLINLRGIPEKVHGDIPESIRMYGRFIDDASPLAWLGRVTGQKQAKTFTDEKGRVRTRSWETAEGIARENRSISGHVAAFLEGTEVIGPDGKKRNIGPYRWENGNMVPTGRRALMAILADAQADYETFKNFVEARVALEYAEQKHKSGPLKGEPLEAGKGDVEELRRYVEDVADKAPRVKELADELHAWYHDILDYVADSGNIPRSLAERLKKDHKWYASFQRVFEDVVGESQGNVQARSTPPVGKERQGSKRKTLDPAMAAIRYANTMIRIADQNRFRIAVAEMADMAPEVTKNLIYKWDKKEMSEAARRVFDDEGHGMDLDMNEASALADSIESVIGATADGKSKDREWHRRNKEFGFWKPEFVTDKDGNTKEIGKYHHYKIDEFIGEVMDSVLQNDRPGFLQKALGVVSLARLVRWGTTHDPQFVLINTLRDAPTAAMQTEFGRTKALVMPFAELSKTLYYGLMHGGARPEDPGALNQNLSFKSTTGSYSNLTGAKLEVMAREYERAVSRALGGRASYYRHPRNWGQLLDKLVEPFESATRRAEFAQAKKAGLSDYEAAHAGREVTVNFSRRGTLAGTGGELARAWMSMVPFLNAGVQSGDKFLRSWGYRPGEDFDAKHAAKAAGRVLFTGTMLMGVESALIWALNKGDDEIERERRTAGGSLYWMWRGPDGKITRLPKPFVWGQIFGTGVEGMLDSFYAQDPERMTALINQVRAMVGKAPHDAKKQTLDVGPGGRTAKQVVKQLLPGGIPPVADILSSLYGNKDLYFGTAIDLPSELTKEPSYRKSPHTGSLSKVLSTGMQKVGEPLGIPTPSPAQTSYIVGKTGTFQRRAYTIGERVADAVTGKVTPSRSLWKELTGRFRPDEPASFGYESEIFGEAFDSATSAKKTYDSLLKTDRKEAAKYKSDKEKAFLIQWAPMLDKENRRVIELQRQRIAALSNKAIPEERRDAVGDGYTKRIIAIKQGMMRRYLKARERLEKD